MAKKIVWTTTESAKLKEMLEAKIPYREISRILGRSRTACEGHAFRIGATQSLRITDEEPLDPVIYKTRLCLSCLEPFQSVSAGNRLCGTCKKNMARNR